jgi:hypothetical protein
MNQQKWLLLGGVCALSLTFTGYAAAQDITYNVDDIIGTGSVMGTITTNGTLGELLSSTDIVSYSLTLNDGTSSALLSSASGGGVFGSFSSGALTATSTALEFDTTNGAAPTITFAPLPTGTTAPCWVLRTDGGTGCTGVAGTTMSVLAAAGNTPMSKPISGDLVFATTPAAVPEPGSLSLLLAGAAGLIARRRRRS